MVSTKFILYSLIFFLCLAAQALSATYYPSNPAFPKSLIKEMAKREMRYHHYIWHNIREGWNRFTPEAREEIRKLGWAPPHPARAYDANGVASPIPDNLSGEDFLYMHRQMIAKANKILAQNKEPYGKVTGWKTVPGPNDKDYPVPPNYTIPGNSAFTNYTNTRKTRDYYYNVIQPMEKALKDPVNLRNMTLSQLGSKIEVTIHSWMHMRFSSESSYGYRPITKEVKPNIDKKWDNPSYDWMGDTYGSHVNPVFWKLHGWVDDRIEDWRRANRLDSIRWKGTWTGGPMSSFSSVLKKDKGVTTSFRGPNGATVSNEDPEAVGDVMEKVFEIFKKEGQEVTFGDKMKIDLDFIEKYKPKNNKPSKTLKSRSKGRSLCQRRN